MIKKIFLILMLVGSTAWGQTKPTIKIVVPYSTGGPVDALARIVQSSLARELDTPVILDYRPGAAGSIGTVQALNNMSEPVLILNGTSAVLNTFKNPQPYSEKQLIPVIYLGRVPLILIGSNKFNVQNIQELQKFKHRPIMYGTAGIGSGVHLSMEKLNQILNLDTVHIPYKGTAPYLVDTIAGHIDMSFVFASPAIVSHIQRKDVIAIAVENHIRLPELKTVPTFKESNIDNVGNFSWFMLFQGGHWDKDHLHRVQLAMQRILSDRQLSEPYKNFGLVWDSKDIIPSKYFIERERNEIASLIKHITLD
jgi:tripartite-type tricarboxylate transporter receptor subunit TctC